MKVAKHVQLFPTNKIWKEKFSIVDVLPFFSAVIGGFMSTQIVVTSAAKEVISTSVISSSTLDKYLKHQQT